MKKNKLSIKIFKWIIFLVMLLLIIGLLIYIIPVLKDLKTLEGQIAFKSKVSDAGIFGMLWLFAMLFAQVFLIFIPGEPIEILTGMCYGIIGGTTFTLISTLLISAIIFLLVRKYGKKFVYSFCDKRHIKRIENIKFFQDPHKVEKIIIILFLVPGTPKALLTYFAGLLPIDISRYIFLSILARIPSTISSIIVGQLVVTGNWKYAIWVYVITYIVVGIIILIMNKLDKSKTTEETLNIIKEKKL